MESRATVRRAYRIHSNSIGSLGSIAITSLCATLLGGCSGTDASGDPENVETGQSPILNGQTINEAQNPAVRLDLLNGGICSSTLLNNRWALTAAHCVNLFVDRRFGASAPGGLYWDELPVGNVDGSAASVVKIDSAGRLLLGGHMDRKFYVERFSAAGVKDTTFGWPNKDGRVVIDFPGTSENVEDIAFMPDGRIVAVGWGTGADDLPKTALVRLLADGTPDSSFGWLGSAAIDFGSGVASRAEGVRIVGGRIVWAGSAWTGGVYNVVLVGHQTTNGHVDQSFGWNGLSLAAPPGSTFALASSMTVDSSGRILVAGLASFTSGQPLLASVARFSAQGVPDSTFGTSGWASAPASFAHSEAKTLLMQGSQILAAGIADAPDGRATLWRFNANGQIDTTFGRNVDGSAIGTGGVRLAFHTQKSHAAVGMTLAGSGDIRLAVYHLDGANIYTPAYAALSSTGQLRADRTFPWANGMVLDGESISGMAQFAPAGMVSTEAGADSRVIIAGTVPFSDKAAFIALKPDRVTDSIADLGLAGTKAGQTLIADRVLLAPADDVALLHFPGSGFSSPTVGGFPTFLPAANFATLQGTNVTCKGFGLFAPGGFDAGTLRQGVSRVTQVGSPHLTLKSVPGAATPQLPLQGDSGASCTSNGRIAGVHSLGNDLLLESSLVRADRFSTWANGVIANP